MTTDMTTAQDRSLASINPLNRGNLGLAAAGAAAGVLGVNYKATHGGLLSQNAYLGMLAGGALWMYLRPTCPYTTVGGTALMVAGAYGGAKTLTGSY